MLNLALTLLPGWLTGRADPRAWRMVRRWGSDNAVAQEYRATAVQKLIIWGTDRPVMYGLATGALCAFLAAVLADPDLAPYPIRLSDWVSKGFDLGAFLGLAWGVQATLVALVYPIVVSFISLMLQQRAFSRVAQRVYILDSGVVPAGASSIALVLWMGLQYLLSPYESSSVRLDSSSTEIICDAFWFVANVLLTGHFLGRTVKFIQESEQQTAYRNLAIGIALPRSIQKSLKQHLVALAPQNDWGLDDDEAIDGVPKVQMVSLGRGDPAVDIQIHGARILVDIHLRFLELAAKFWLRRAFKFTEPDPAKTLGLYFNPVFDVVLTDVATLCRVEGGPTLNGLEKFLVKRAFCLRPRRKGTPIPTPGEMLKELSLEVGAKFEANRFTIAEEGFRQLTSLHKTLLKASATTDLSNPNLARFTSSPYSFAATSFDLEWLGAYREVGRAAVARLSEDVRLFRLLAAAPQVLCASLNAYPEPQLVMNCLLIGTNLFWQSGNWWMREADQSAGGWPTKVPRRLASTYEEAIKAFVGSWDGIRIRTPKNLTSQPELLWHHLAGQNRFYVRHIEATAQMFAEALDHGDEIAADWLLECFLKWWGTKQYEFRIDEPASIRFRPATYKLSDKRWEELEVLFFDRESPFSIKTAEFALNLALRRYWECLRLYLAVSLITSALNNPAATQAYLNYGSLLVLGQGQKRGSEVVAWHLASFDAFCSGILYLMFEPDSSLDRVDAFGGTIRSSKELPEISGWFYSYYGTPEHFGAMKLAQAIAIVALASHPKPALPRCIATVTNLWRGIELLGRVGNYCVELRDLIVSPEFTAHLPMAEQLAEKLKVPFSSDSRSHAATSLLKLRDLAHRERQLTLAVRHVKPSDLEVLKTAISTHMLDPKHWPNADFCKLRLSQRTAATSWSKGFRFKKAEFVDGDFSRAVRNSASHISKVLLLHGFAWAVEDCANANSIPYISDGGMGENYHPTAGDLHNFLQSLESQRQAVYAAGDLPVILLGSPALRGHVNPFKWGSGSWQTPLPDGIELRQAKQGEPASALAMLNGTPVFACETLDGHSFIMPSSLIRFFDIGAVDTKSAVRLKSAEDGTEDVVFQVEWEADLVNA